MELINLDSIVVKGISVRTNNTDEMTDSANKIPALWQQAGEEVFPNMLVGGSIYGIYHNYASDVNGDYDLLVGSDKVKVDNTEVKLEEGKYLKFEATGEMPDACIKLWQDVWAYFNSEECSYERAYTTDFEKYNQHGVEIYIAVK